MQSLGLDVKNPMIFRMIADLEKDGYSSIDFEEFMEVITSKLVIQQNEKAINILIHITVHTFVCVCMFFSIKIMFKKYIYFF